MNLTYSPEGKPCEACLDKTFAFNDRTGIYRVCCRACFDKAFLAPQENRYGQREYKRGCDLRHWDEHCRSPEIKRKRALALLKGVIPYEDRL